MGITDRNCHMKLEWMEHCLYRLHNRQKKFSRLAKAPLIITGSIKKNIC